MTAGWTIRPAGAIDADAVQRLYRRTVSQALWLPAARRSETDFASASRGETVYVCVATDGALLGFISVLVRESFIHHLYVAPAQQRRGVGAALLASLNGWLPLPWRLKCARANADAAAFYMSQGWLEVGSGVGEQGPYQLLEWRAAQGSLPPIL